MSNNSGKPSSGCLFGWLFALYQTIVVVLRVLGVIKWSWLAVLLPIEIAVLWQLMLGLLVGFIMMLTKIGGRI